MGHRKLYLTKKDRPYIALAMLLGFINHFLYGLSGGASWIAVFCPVNESAWEHLKLVFFPLLLVSVLEYLRFQKNAARFFYYRFLSTVSAMGSIIVLFYTYTGVIGRNFVVLDILIFLFSILLAFAACNYCCQRRLTSPSHKVILSLWLITVLAFAVFTCFPPSIPLFLPCF